MNNSIRDSSMNAAALSAALVLSLIGVMCVVHSLAMSAASPISPQGGRTVAFDNPHILLSGRGGGQTHRKRTLPVHRSILAIDIENSTQRTNPVKEELRQHIYQLVLDALGSTGINDQCRDPFTDRGDGMLMLIRPTDDIPKPLLLSRFIPALADLLCRHNDAIPSEERTRLLRLRAVLHAGEVHYDGKGFFGEDLDVAFRLLDAPKFKAYLRHGMGPIGLVVSDDIYWSVIHHGYDGINGHEFQPLVTVTVAGRRRKGWVHLPSASGSPVRIAS